jgi:hypothetical protein
MWPNAVHAQAALRHHVAYLRKACALPLEEVRVGSHFRRLATSMSYALLSFGEMSMVTR